MVLWGKQRYAKNITPTGHRYTAQRFDDKRGLYDYQARYYDPHIGRFISPDTFVPNSANPQSYNRYAYVENRPLNFIDPTGHFLETAWDAVNVGLGLHSLYNNLKDGNYGWAAVDAVGVVVDTAALLVPVVPGGVGSVIKAARGVDSAVTVVQNTNRAGNAIQAANQTANAAQTGASAANHVNNAGSFSNSAHNFRRNVGAQAGEEAHHLIPNQSQNHPFVQRATAGGWEQHAAYNGMALPNNPSAATTGPYHRGPHSNYNNDVRTRLTNLETQAWQNSWSNQRALQELQNLSQQLRQEISNRLAGIRLN